MAKQQPEGVYLYINDSGERFIAIIDAFGMANMWMGVFADVGVTLIAILNSMRALKIR